MKAGGKATLTIPAALAYGPLPVGSIPGNSALQVGSAWLPALPERDEACDWPAYD